MAMQSVDTDDARQSVQSRGVYELGMQNLPFLIAASCTCSSDIGGPEAVDVHENNDSAEDQGPTCPARMG